MATYSISGVMIPAFAYSYWVTGRPSTPLKTLWFETSKRGARFLPLAWPLSSGLTSRGFRTGAMSPRSSCQLDLTSGRPFLMSMVTVGSV